MAEQGLQSAVSRLESVASRLEALAGKGNASGGSAASDKVPEFVVEFDKLMNGSLAEFLALSAAIGGDVKTSVDFMKEAFDAEKALLNVAAKSKKPSNDVERQLLQPLASRIEAAQKYREMNRRSQYFNHLSVISESIAALGWVQLAPTPAPFVMEMLDAGTFYSNKILQEYKKTDTRHVDWANSLKKVIKSLHDYVKEYHTTGVSWNPQGDTATACAAPSSAPPPPPGGAPPPPPPPPPPSMADLSGGPSPEDNRGALFASINQGETVTKGLRKVTDDMKTHKNPALRQGPAPFKANSSPKPPATAPKPTATKTVTSVKPPVFELEAGKKWIVEHHKNNKSIVIDGEMKQTIYVYKCEESVIQVKGKINSVVLDSCKKTAVVFEDVLSSVEFVNCQSVQGQVTGKVNTLSIDKTDGCQFYLSEASLDIEIVTAKSSEMNILVPQGDGDFKEFALPEQYKTKYTCGKMVTTATESI